MNETEIFLKLGFKQDVEFEHWTHKDLPFDFWVCADNRLAISFNNEYYFDQCRIPFSEENLKKILEAFNPK